MKKKTALFALLVLSAFVSFGWARSAPGFRIPLDHNGRLPLSLKEVGVYVKTVSFTETASVVKGDVIVLGVLTSTKPQAMDDADDVTATLRSSDTANTTSEKLVPNIMFKGGSTNTLVVFDYPILSTGGLSINVSTKAARGVSVFYRFASTGTDQDEVNKYSIPLDQDGREAHSYGFVGVKVATVQTAGGGADDGLGADSLNHTSDEVMLSTNPGSFYGVTIGTGTGGYCVTEDTSSTLGDKADFIVPIYPATWQYEYVANTKLSKYATFPWPVNFVYGLSFQMSSTANEVRAFVKEFRKNTR